MIFPNCEMQSVQRTLLYFSQNILPVLYFQDSDCAAQEKVDQNLNILEMQTSTKYYVACAIPQGCTRLLQPDWLKTSLTYIHTVQSVNTFHTVYILAH